MARKKIKNSAQLGTELQRLIQDASRTMQEEMERLAPKVAEVARVSYDRELRATGLERSDVSGSADKQSMKSKGKASNSKSIFDTRGEVIRLKDGRLVAKGGSDIDSDYIAKFWDKDAPQFVFGEPTGESLNDYSAVDAKDFAAKAFKTANAQIKEMFAAAFERALKKIK